MQLTVAHIGAKSAKAGVKSGFETLTRLYLDRIAPYHPVQTEVFRSEADFLDSVTRPRSSGKSGRVPALLVLLDSRGKLLSSPDFATWLGARRDQGAQHLIFAIGPADGWSEEARASAAPSGGMLLSFGPITLPHELARLVLAEQLYRACTILAGHPYHSGH